MVGLIASEIGSVVYNCGMDAQPPTNNQPVTDDQLADNKTVSLHRGCPPPSAEECQRRGQLGIERWTEP